MKRLLLLAGLLVAARILSGLLGFDAALGLLSGMVPPGMSLEGAAAACAFHVGTHLAAVLVAPVLVLAAALSAGLSALTARRARASGAPSGSRAG